MLLKLLTLILLLTMSIYAQQISHNGYVYGTVKSHITGNIWLDRNIGADRVCQSFDDKQCYGDYFQWGRDADGHEKQTSYSTRAQATSIKNAGSKFIKAKIENRYDWARIIDPKGEKRKANWEKTDGSSVCPKEFRVPSTEELEDETTEGGGVTNIETASNSFLKLPSSGARAKDNGLLIYQGFSGSIWSTTNSSASSDFLTFNNKIAFSFSRGRAGGLPVRCLKN